MPDINILSFCKYCFLIDLDNIPINNPHFDYFVEECYPDTLNELYIFD